MALINPLIDTPLIRNIVLAFFATTFIASANYVINEYLDRDFDKYHPIKKYRPIVSGNINVKIIWLERGILTIFGTVLARHINVETFCIIILFWLM
ncbi:MAG: UbiA family prenyltransferase [Candidatus Peribacteria bacterium]|jgi:4-hydroxybenzoate polyprenyltransferase|nr:UbiA family prenyltransferase [Candidatus Peribacteria bacterium]